MRLGSETLMRREASSAPRAVAAQLDRNAALIQLLGRRLRELDPRAIVTCARGSSDHAATFAKYLIETHTGVLTSSASPSVASVYATRPKLAGTAFLAISQSGASPDLLACVEMAKLAGARVFTTVGSDEKAELARAHGCDHPIVYTRASRRAPGMNGFV